MIFEKASIIDGGGGKRFSTDIALVGERIARIGDCSNLEARQRIDARALVLAPGFIDVHAHSEQRWFAPRSSAGSIAQGITTAIEGACDRGFSAEQASELRGSLRLNLALVASARREDIERGACGLSVRFGDAVPTDETLRLAKDAGIPIVAHLRDRERELLAALDEALALARRYETPLHIAHFSYAYGKDRALVNVALERIDAHRARGLPVSCDLFPYIADEAPLGALFPSTSGSVVRSDDAALAAMLHARLHYEERWKTIWLRGVHDERDLDDLGASIEAIAARRRISCERAALALFDELGAETPLLHRSLNEDDVATALSADFTCIGTADASYSFDEDPFRLPHPRAFGSFPRLFSRFVRVRHTLPLEEAVRRCTSLPAQIFGLRDRGAIREGAFADLVLFDEARIADTATYDSPVRAPEGIRAVFVNGTAVYGTPMGEIAYPGRILEKQ
uniref:Putative N-acyl-D-glutamate deacylase n=1 Tax=mine drainage metagenome TaxID=410659 RepID=E6PGN4_9ZZZZ